MMSHYSVFVAVRAGSAEEAVEAAEAAMDPFSEYYEVDAYEEEVVQIEVERALAYADEQRIEAGGSLVDREDAGQVQRAVTEWIGRDVERREDGSFYYESTCNPDGHWDWWVVGGRWAGAFELRDGSRVDVARAVDVDLAGMRQAAEQAAQEAYDAFEVDTAGLVPGPRWSTLYARHGEAGRDQARDEFAADPWVTVARKGLWFADPHDYWCVDAEDPRQEFVTRQVAQVAVPYAWLQEGRWEQKGWIGMFMAMTPDEAESDAKWAKHVTEGWEALQQPQHDDDGAEWWVVTVDCHT